MAVSKNITIEANGLQGDDLGRVLGYNLTTQGVYTPVVGTCLRDSNKKVIGSDGQLKQIPPNQLGVDYSFGKAEVWLQPAETYTIDGQLVTTQADFLIDFANSILIDSQSGILFLQARPYESNNGVVRLTNGTSHIEVGFNSGNIVAIANGTTINGGAYINDTEYKICVKYNSGNFELFVNNVSLGSSTFTPFSANTLNELDFNGYLRFSKVVHNEYNTDINTL